MFLLGSPIFLILQGSLTPIARIAGATTILSLLTVLIFTGKPETPKAVSISKYKAAPVHPSSETGPPPIMDVPIEQNNSPTTSDTMKSGEDDQNPPEQSTRKESNTDESPRIAKKYAVSSDAQIEFEDEVESYVENRRERRSEIRDRIERERRKALAPMRTRRLREWAEREDGEGLEEILLNSNHGLKVLEYDYPKVASTITGSTYVRLDDHRIVKINREIPFEPASGRAVATDPESSGGQEVADNNSNLPPPPPPSGLPPPPPPL